MPRYLYKITHYKRNSECRIASTIHVIAESIPNALEILANNDFNSEGITNIINEGETFMRSFND